MIGEMSTTSEDRWSQEAGRPSRGNGFATTSLCSGLLGLALLGAYLAKSSPRSAALIVLFYTCETIAFWSGLIGLSRVRLNGSGRAFAIAGLVLSITAVVVTVVAIAGALHSLSHLASIG
jgi:hypothetical protein